MVKASDKIDPVEIANRIVAEIGDATELGKSVSIERRLLKKIEGVENLAALFIILSELENQGLVAIGRQIGGGLAKLTFRGWEHYNSLESGEIAGTTAFLAHQFGDPVISVAMKEFGSVCDKCGYRPVDLELVEHLKAGGINNRIELEIKLSKFVIADLTLNNNGAYWEAGFAAGLGRKVIYTCRQDFFETAKTHFDVNHHMTILWQPDNLTDAEEKLDACIRNTFMDDKNISSP